jgi:hypothetical protein
VTTFDDIAAQDFDEDGVGHVLLRISGLIAGFVGTGQGGICTNFS